MLDSSKARLAEASPEDRLAAEIIAFASMTSSLEEDLLPAEQAAATAQEHRAGGTEEWVRAVHGALVGLLALKNAGFRFAKS